MPALQVRDFPDALYSELKAYAAANHRSIAQQTVACIEEALAREKDTGALQQAKRGDDPAVPMAVSIAALQAQGVDPFAWKLGLGVEPEEVRAARREKRKALRSRSERLARAWRGNAPSSTEIAAMIREERELRSDVVTGGADADGRFGEAR